MVCRVLNGPTKFRTDLRASSRKKFDIYLLLLRAAVPPQVFILFLNLKLCKLNYKSGRKCSRPPFSTRNLHLCRKVEEIRISASEVSGWCPLGSRGISRNPANQGANRTTGSTTVNNGGILVKFIKPSLSRFLFTQCLAIPAAATDVLIQLPPPG